MPSSSDRSLYARLSLINIAYLLAVIAFGAFVRATGSGAGCGSHWPLCNGDVIPRAPSVQTMIEFTHRVTSGLTLPAALVLLFLAWRWFAARHPVRWASGAVVCFVIFEGLIGAGLVLLEHVADNRSNYRALSMAAHLISTFALMAVAVLQWHGARSVRTGPTLSKGDRWLYGIGVVALLLAGLSGAITALGDTLYPVTHPGQAWQQSLDGANPLLVQLRVYHPLIATTVGGFLIWLSHQLRHRYEHLNTICMWLTCLVGAQLLLGYLNVQLMAPIWLQLTHLLLAQVVWMTFIVLGAKGLGFRHHTSYSLTN